MTWRGRQVDARARYVEIFDAAEVERYETQVGQLTVEQQDAYLADLDRMLTLRPGSKVLDAGAGTGAMCQVLRRRPGLGLTALEPASTMLARLRGKPELRDVECVRGFCDHVDDRRLFGAGEFDVVVSRQLVNGLFDPLAAFRNWRHWLAFDGVAVVIDGVYDRSAWTGPWEAEVDVLPLSACQSTATVPYLLEQAGFRIEAVEWMAAVNALPSTRTKRYLVIARAHDLPTVQATGRRRVRKG